MDHECQWGPIEHATFTGNPYRKCQVLGCDIITLDLTDDDESLLDDVEHTSDDDDKPVFEN